jgi:hypothetical protein
MTAGGSWSGGIASGGREYTPEDVAQVVAALPRGRQEAMSLRTFVDSLPLEARAARAVLSDRDGVDFLLAYDDGLMWAAEFLEEGYGHTEMLRARARKELARVARRERYAATMARRQGVLIP